MTWLLDSSVLIALIDREHSHHERAAAWIGQGVGFSTCPITEGALVRYLVRAGAAPSAIRQALTLLAAHPKHSFWPDDLPYAEIDLESLVGHRQVTDAYLVSLVRRHGPDAKLATLDQALARLHPDVADAL